MQHEVPRRLQPGEGLIRLNRERSTGRAWFENVQFSYPLKLITPARHYKTGVHAVYVLSYGGGLVAGDRIKLDVAVQGGSTLVMLTQGRSSCQFLYVQSSDPPLLALRVNESVQDEARSLSHCRSSSTEIRQTAEHHATRSRYRFKFSVQIFADKRPACGHTPHYD